MFYQVSNWRPVWIPKHKDGDAFKTPRISISSVSVLSFRSNPFSSQKKIAPPIASHSTVLGVVGGHSRIWTNMFTDIAVEHNDWITVPFDVTAAVHEYGLSGGIWGSGLPVVTPGIGTDGSCKIRVLPAGQWFHMVSLSLIFHLIPSCLKLLVYHFIYSRGRGLGVSGCVETLIAG